MLVIFHKYPKQNNDGHFQKKSQDRELEPHVGVKG